MFIITLLVFIQHNAHNTRPLRSLLLRRNWRSTQTTQEK